MLEDFANAVMEVVSNVQSNFVLLANILILLWGLLFLNAILGYRLNILGIYPRHVFGLLGIVCSPFIHGSVKHLFFNSIPLVVLSALILVKGQNYFFQATLMIILLSGLLTWLFGRRAFHVGASSVIMGYWSFLLFEAFLQRSILSIILAILCLYYFGSLLLNVFPREERVSWESHLFGLLAGIVVSYVLTYGMVSDTLLQRLIKTYI